MADRSPDGRIATVRGGAVSGRLKLPMAGLIALAVLAAPNVPQAGGESSEARRVVVHDSFRPTRRPMLSARIGAVAILLKNGKVLIAGGLDSQFHAIAEAELYSPAKNRFVATRAAMNQARYLACGALLANGRVLIAGGAGEDGRALAEAELYVPRKRKFVPSSHRMTIARVGASATPLADGRILITGGVDDQLNNLSTAELYDPRTDTFTPSTNEMSYAAGYSPAVPLPNGEVLVPGIESGDLYDPVRDSFEAIDSFIPEPLRNPTASLLGTGNVLIAAGESLDVTGSADLFQPTTNVFVASNATSIGGDREGATATTLGDGRVLFAGGTDEQSVPLDSAELYDPTADGFIASGSVMSDSRQYATATPLKGGEVLIAGGFDAEGRIVATADLYSP